VCRLPAPRSRPNFPPGRGCPGVSRGEPQVQPSSAHRSRQPPHQTCPPCAEARRASSCTPRGAGGRGMAASEPRFWTPELPCCFPTAEGCQPLTSTALKTRKKVAAYLQMAKLKSAGQAPGRQHRRTTPRLSADEAAVTSVERWRPTGRTALVRRTVKFRPRRQALNTSTARTDKQLSAQNSSGCTLAAGPLPIRWR
jgi:hypothetical protein